MKKKFFVLVTIFCVIATSGCLGPRIEKPVVEGIDCKENLLCLGTNFLACEKAYSTIKEENEEIFFQILGPKDDKCEVYLQLNKSAKVPEMLYGLDAKCKLSLQELLELSEKMNIEEQDCEGPLYEAAKNAKKFGLTK